MKSRLSRADHPLRAQLEALRITKASVADRYGCRQSFVHACLCGRYRTPARLEALMRKMIEERREELKRLLEVAP
jgi:hypothetical protein